MSSTTLPAPTATNLELPLRRRFLQPEFDPAGRKIVGCYLSGETAGEYEDFMPGMAQRTLD
jgi:hypothetical protein